MYYSELVVGGVKHRGLIRKLPEKINNMNIDYFGKQVVDSFHSIFLHTKDYELYTKTRGSVKGYNGPVYSDYLFWDIDNENLDVARSDTIELVERLFAYNQENVHIFFSGNKGFHVYYYSPEIKTIKDFSNFNHVTRNACLDIASGISSVDNKVYDKTRIIRSQNSKHSKTNLYKIEISYDELISLNNAELQLIASTQRKSNERSYNMAISDEIIDLLNKSEEIKERKGGLYNASELISGIRYGFSRGNRNSGFASMAGVLHSRGIDDNFIKALLQANNQSSSDPLPEEEIESIVASVSRYPVNSDYVEPQDDDIIDIKEAGEAWYDVFEKSGYTSFGDRFGHLNDRMKMCIPGDTVAFVATSGTGKTTMGLELGNSEATSNDKYSLVASLEMSRAGIFFRAATIEAVDLSIDNYVPSSDVASTLLKDTALRDRVYSSWKNLKIIDKGGLSLDKIIEYYKRAQEKYNNKLSNLVIDYAQNIRDSEKIDYAMMMARRFKEVAKDLQTKLIVLMQTNKTIPDDYTEVQRNHIEGSGAYVQAMDYIIAAWKSRDQKNRLHCKFMKDRWGDSEFRFDLVREGLKYHTEDYVPDRNAGGL